MAEQMASIAPSRISVSGERAASKQTGRRGECRKGTVTFPPNLSHEARHANMRSTMTLSPLYSSRQCSKKGKTDTEFWPYWSATRLRSSCVSTRRGLPISSGRTVRNSSNPTITVRSFSLPKFSIMSSAGDVHTSHIWMARSAMARASCTAMLRLRPPRVEIEAQSASRSESRESSGTSVNAACTFMRIVCAAKKVYLGFNLCALQQRVRNFPSVDGMPQRTKPFVGCFALVLITCVRIQSVHCGHKFFRRWFRGHRYNLLTSGRGGPLNKHAPS
mmetsp:Transcript_24905/g.64872  ORF Transcript_24905/g.64872 Transcript_24905/m.64872 type:complete len:275 (+) Transcript_24905:2229-3053(+)